jgi:hypothetical protein
MIDPDNRLGFVVGHTGQGLRSTAAVYSFPDLDEPRTLAAFVADNSPDALGNLEGTYKPWRIIADRDEGGRFRELRLTPNFCSGRV